MFQWFKKSFSLHQILHDRLGLVEFPSQVNLLHNSITCSILSRDLLHCKSKKDGPSDHKKCLCKHKECSWVQKSQKCPITTNDNGDSGAISGGNHSGNLSDLSNISGMEGLRSIMREISLTNNGNINVNFNLR